MKRAGIIFPFLITMIFQAAAQMQSADGEGVLQASYLKKLSKKAKYGAYLINKQIEFGTGKGINNQPIVTAEERGNVEMVALENKAVVGYLINYNQFVKVTDYDFGILYNDKFRSQKYPPEKISLTDESIFLDDNYGLFYGFKADEAGQRCRFKYTYNYTDAKYLTRIFFHESVPVRSSGVSFKVPNWLQLDIAEQNFTGYKIKKETQKGKDFTTYTYTADNLSGIKRESSSLARPYYLPHLVIIVRSFTVNQKQYNGFKGLDDMYAWYNYLYKKAENNPDALKTQVTQLTQGKATDEQKIKALYYWVQDNIRYIAFEEGYSGFVPQTAQEVYKNKYGDCKGMANVLTEMLKIAGYAAHFAWIGTKDIPYDRKQIQSMCVDNHAICVLYLKGKTYFLDGTQKYEPLGKNAYRIQDKNVMIEHGDSYKTEIVPAAAKDENNITKKATLKLNGEKIEGHIAVTFDGEAKNFFHNIYNSIPTNKRKEFVNNLLQMNANSEVTNVKTSDFTNRDIPISLEGDIEINNHVTLVDNLCYTSIDFFPGSITGYIPTDERQNPIDIGNTFMVNDEVTLELPASAKVQTLPQPFKADFKNDNVEASYTQQGNKVLLKKKLQINSPVIYTNEFTDWKNFINKIKEFNRNNITVQL